MPSGIAIFCDDIRQEAGNKLSYMGVYDRALYIDEEFPITLSKLCVVINFLVYKTEPLPKSFSFSVKFAGAEKPFFAAPIATLKPGASFAETNSLGHEIVGLKGAANIILSPLNVVEPSTLEVFLVTPDGSTEIGSLEIRPPESAGA